MCINLLLGLFVVLVVAGFVLGGMRVTCKGTRYNSENIQNLSIFI